MKFWIWSSVLSGIWKHLTPGLYGWYFVHLLVLLPTHHLLPISRVLLYNLHCPLTHNPLASFSDSWDCRYGAEIGWSLDSSFPILDLTYTTYGVVDLNIWSSSTSMSFAHGIVLLNSLFVFISSYLSCMPFSGKCFGWPWNAFSPIWSTLELSYSTCVLVTCEVLFSLYWSLSSTPHVINILVKYFISLLLSASCIYYTSCMYHTIHVWYLSNVYLCWVFKMVVLWLRL